MQQVKEVRLGLAEPSQRAELVVEERAGLARVGDGIADALPDQLVVLNQAVIGIFRESDGGQDESINDRQAQHGMPGICLPQDAQVVPHQVMSENATRRAGH